MVQTMKRQKDQMAEAYSNEKGVRIKLQENLYDKDFRLSQQEREIREIRLQNERFVEAERYSIRQIEDLNARNNELMTDNDNYLRQIRAQEDALIQA
jgi:hypothetical protein